MSMNNLVYDDVHDIVEDLVRIKSRKFAKGFLSADDIAQEIRLKCYLSLENFNAEKGQSIKTYLNVCTENHLRNLIRDKFAKFDPPCRLKGCYHYDQGGRPTSDSDKCKEFQKYIVKYNRKCSARMPAAMDESWAHSIDGQDSSLEDTEIQIQVMEVFQMEFPENWEKMFGSYQDLLAGKKVGKTIKIKIQKAIERLYE